MIKVIKYLKKEYRKGSITVEAAFIMPIVIVTIFAMIYLAFYLHDICRIQGILNKTLHKASISVKHETDFATGVISYEDISDRGVFYIIVGNTEEDEIQIQNYLQQELAKGLFLCKLSRTIVNVNKSKIIVSVKVETNVSLPGIKHLFDSLTKAVITGEYSIHDPAESIRRVEVALDTGSKIKGVEKLKEKLDGIFDFGNK